MDRPIQARVRPAAPTDAPALAQLRFEFRAARREVVEAELPFVSRCTAWMARALSDADHWRVWVADDGARLVGNVWLQLVDKLPNPGAELERHGYLTNFYIKAEFRGAGLGASLLDALLAECRALEVDTVFLWPTDRSRSLYERHGFAASGDILARAASS